LLAILLLRLPVDGVAAAFLVDLGDALGVAFLGVFEEERLAGVGAFFSAVLGVGGLEEERAAGLRASDLGVLAAGALAF
jgi:hypothetical protein